MGVSEAGSARARRIASRLFWVVITLGPLTGILLNFVGVASFASIQEWAGEFARAFGPWTALAFIGLQVVQVVVPPVSHYAVGYMGGLLFGPYRGALYNYVGRVLGHTCAYLLARTVGTRFVARWVPPETREKYDRLVGSRPFILFLVYYLPFLPDDEVTYLVGLARMPFGWFLLANVFGQVGGSIVLAYLGAGIAGKDPVFWSILGAAAAGFPLLWWLARRAGPSARGASVHG